ncbi:S-adenosyl-L-methionine-dependent methyltransferase [Coniochaeta sp. PMI_546]|nr:S-adenosyl-L-methionine-dependent methyltransferase [Coniochaeta sp. PMI_546]
MAPQNVYDNATFFENYSTLPRSVHGLDGAPEWPRLQSFLPDLKDLKVLDLGCGFGWFCRWAVDHGAATVHGIDISNNMLERARVMTEGSGSTYAGITYTRADLDSLELPESATESYDLVFSSLAFHYLENLPRLLQLIHRVLKPGGKLVFNVEHPIFTAPPAPALKVDPETGRKYWKLEDYQKQGLRHRPWFVDGVEKQHRTMTAYINLLLQNGFELSNFDEWYPTAEDLEAHPGWETEIIRPMFLLIGARKK